MEIAENFGTGRPGEICRKIVKIWEIPDSGEKFEENQIPAKIWGGFELRITGDDKMVVGEIYRELVENLAEGEKKNIQKGAEQVLPTGKPREITVEKSGRIFWIILVSSGVRRNRIFVMKNRVTEEILWIFGDRIR